MAESMRGCRNNEGALGERNSFRSIVNKRAGSNHRTGPFFDQGMQDESCAPLFLLFLGVILKDDLFFLVIELLEIDIGKHWECKTAKAVFALLSLHQRGERLLGPCPSSLHVDR